MNNKFNIDFVARKKLFFIISIAAIAVSILSSFIFGANLDIKSGAEYAEEKVQRNARKKCKAERINRSCG